MKDTGIQTDDSLQFYTFHTTVIPGKADEIV